MSDHKPKPTSVLIELEPKFEQNAPAALANTQLRRATWAKRRRRSAVKRANVVGELSDRQELREAGRAIKAFTLEHLDEQLLQLEAAVQKAWPVTSTGRRTRPRPTVSSPVLSRRMQR